LRIAIDAHSVGTQLAGNESYAVNLIEALAQIDQVNEYTLYLTQQSAVARFQHRWPNFSVRRTLPHTPIVRIPLTLSAELRRRPVDLLHVQFTAPPFTPCPFVTSIHDLSFEHLPQTFRRRSRLQLRLTVRRSARSAAHVLVPSEFVRRDILQTYELPPERVSTIPLAAAEGFRPVTEASEIERIRQTYDIPDRYILSVGSIQPRKNLAQLIAAYSLLRRERSGDKLPRLVLVGKAAWLYGETLRKIAASGIENSIVVTGYVPDNDLPALYSGATCFVYPSFFEGFGIPPLEAMKCGAPVITGNRTSLPEVVGDAALMVNPFDETEIAAAIGRLLDDSDLRATLRVKGLKRAGEFEWNQTARRTLEIYQRVAERRGR